MRLPLLVALCWLPLLAACTRADTADTVDIVSGAPWKSAEAARYVIVDEHQNQKAEGILSVSQDDDGNTVFLQQFSDDDGNSDRSTLVAHPGDLRPLAGERLIIDARNDRRVIALTRYSADNKGKPLVRIAELNYGSATDTSKDPSLRCSPLKIDSPHFYDNDESLFIWRTITFEQGWSATYTNVLSNRRTQRAITVRVRKQEKVTTPAGEFDAWNVGIEGEGRETQEAWFATTPDHKLLIYNNRENQVFMYAGETDVPTDISAPTDLPEKCR